MHVTRVRTEHGSHVEPPLRQEWDDTTKLVWNAAVVAHDTGLEVKVSPMQDGWAVLVDGARTSGSIGLYSFQEAWTYLVGVSAGARAG